MKKIISISKVISLCIVAMFLLTTISYASDISVENVRIDKTTYNGRWIVRGMVRNLEDHPIKGGVKIKFLNAQGDVVYTHSAFVNSLDPLDPGQAGHFKYVGDATNTEGAVKFQFIFIDR